MSKKTALVFGVQGQDGSYLSEFLLDKGYRVIGVKRRCSSFHSQRLINVECDENFKLIEGDVVDHNSVRHIIKKYQPNEIYNLAAMSHVHTSFEQTRYTFEVNQLGVLNILEGVVEHSPASKVYQASTSELFGSNFSIDENGERFQNEETALLPNSPYACAKLGAHNLVRVFRDAYNIFGCCGVLYNHESSRRGAEFVTRKITLWLAELYNWISSHFTFLSEDKELKDCLVFKFDEDKLRMVGQQGRISNFEFPKLRLGNLDSYRDWGHSKDYVKAMWMMLQNKEPVDYVVATGKAYSVRDFCRIAFGEIGIENYMDYIVIDSKFFRPVEVPYLRGDATKIKNELGWEPKISFEELVKEMVSADINCEGIY